MDEPFSTPMQEGTTGLHELYLGLRSGGFSRFEGLVIVAQIMMHGGNEDSAEPK